VLHRKKGSCVQSICADGRTDPGALSAAPGGRRELGRGRVFLIWAISSGVDGQLKPRKPASSRSSPKSCTSSPRASNRIRKSTTGDRSRAAARMRYLDLIYTEGVLERFQAHANRGLHPADACGRAVCRSRRATLHSIAGGAAARAVHHASQCAGYAAVFADCAGAALEAAAGGRHGAGIRARPRVPQRSISPRHNPSFTMLESTRPMAITAA